MQKIIKTIILIISIIVTILAALTAIELSSMYRTHHMKEISFEPATPDYWPSPDWRISTPEEEGMDSTKLIEMIEFYRKTRDKNSDIMIDSISIIRNGYLVSDIYFNPLFPPGAKHSIHSCTKSIMSILIGIAIDQGYIQSVDLPVYKLLKNPPYEYAENSEGHHIRSLTLKHLLTMQTGLKSRDSYLYRWEGLFEMQAAADWTKHILELPLEAAPGSRFEYSNMASFLLSAIIAQSTGMDTLAFAKKYLFEPLEIRDVKWEKSPKGVYIGWARMWLKPHDMAKIGQLYLQKGIWEERRIVSGQWVEESIRAHSFPEQYRFFYDDEGEIDFGKSGAVWSMTNLSRPLSDGYGYQWWLDESGIFSAIGIKGQFIAVVPEQNLVIVVTSKLKGEDSFFPVKLIKKFIIPSVVSNQPIEGNPQAVEKLASLSLAPDMENDLKAVPALPAIANEISGKTFTLDSALDLNPWQNNNFRLIFTPGQNFALFQFDSLLGRNLQYKVGLDNTYHASQVGGGTHMARGEWIDSDTFVIEYELVGYSHQGRWTLTYEENEILVDEQGVTGTYSYSGTIIKE